MAVEYDPVTGLPKKAKAANQPPALATGQTLQDQIAASLAANPQGTFGPSSGVNYAGAQPQATTPGMPDYKALIAAALGPLTAQYGADDAADMATRNQQLIRALGQFGQQFDLEGANTAFGADFVNSSGLADVLPQANALAQQTTDAGMSFQARAAKAHKDTVRQIKNALAARGLLQSGETGHQLQEQQTQFDTGQYDARAQVQDYMAAVNQGYTQAVRARQVALAEAQRVEAARQAQLNPGTTTPAPVAPAGPVAPPAPAYTVGNDMGSAGLDAASIRAALGPGEFLPGEDPQVRARRLRATGGPLAVQ